MCIGLQVRSLLSYWQGAPEKSLPYYFSNPEQLFYQLWRLRATNDFIPQSWHAARVSSLRCFYKFLFKCYFLVMNLSQGSLECRQLFPQVQLSHSLALQCVITCYYGCHYCLAGGTPRILNLSLQTCSMNALATPKTIWPGSLRPWRAKLQ